MYIPCCHEDMLKHKTYCFPLRKETDGSPCERIHLTKRPLIKQYSKSAKKKLLLLG